MALPKRFKRSEAEVQVPREPLPESAEEMVIDAEATELTPAPSSTPVRRAAALPEAAAPQALERRSERDLAVRNVAVATAGGLVAGAATIAVAAVAKTAVKHATAPTPGLSRRRRKDILQSQSFLVDVHVLKPGR